MYPNRFVQLYEFHRLYKALSDITSMLPHREYHLTKARQSRLATSAPHETVQGKANKRLPKNKGMNADDHPSHGHRQHHSRQPQQHLQKADPH